MYYAYSAVAYTSPTQHTNTYTFTPQLHTPHPHNTPTPSSTSKLYAQLCTLYYNSTLTLPHDDHYLINVLNSNSCTLYLLNSIQRARGRGSTSLSLTTKLIIKIQQRHIKIKNQNDHYCIKYDNVQFITIHLHSFSSSSSSFCGPCGPCMCI